jgi:hypothetical protein
MDGKARSLYPLPEQQQELPTKRFGLVASLLSFHRIRNGELPYLLSNLYHYHSALTELGEALVEVVEFAVVFRRLETVVEREGVA